MNEGEVVNVLSDSLLASSVNGGGVFLADASGVQRLSQLDTTAIAAVPDGLLWARQAEGLAELRHVRAPDVQRIVLTAQSLDLHDVLWHDDRLYVVATQTNTIFEFDAATYAEIRRWTLPGEPDAQHLNSICIHEGRLLASRFGQFTEHRGYKGRTRGAGEVFDIETGEVVISGLSQPHSLKSVDGLLWLCDSEAYALRAYRDFRIESEVFLDGYARGLAFGPTRIYVGLSRSRNDPSGVLANACIVALDRGTLRPETRIQLPTNEIYDLVVVDIAAAMFREVGINEAFAELDSVRHERNLAAIEAHEQRALANRLADLLHAANVRGNTLEGMLQTTRVELADTLLEVLEGEIWGGMLQNAVAVREHYIDTVTGSRSWRWTRKMRSAEPERPQPLKPVPPLPQLAADGEAGATGSGPVIDGIGHSPVAFVPIDLQSGSMRAMVPVLGIGFAVHDHPAVSIVVTSYGNYKQTLACLRAIARSGDAATFEVILIEDCSGDEEMRRLANIPGLRYYENTANLGFLRSANQSLVLARGSYIHFLNNDTLVRPGWLDSLLRTFTAFHQCGIAGSRLVYPDGKLQEAGGIVWSDGDACNFGRGDDPSLLAYQTVREVDYVSGASLLVPTELLHRLGGFDERYAPAYYEDTDLAFRVRSQGLKVYVQPASIVVHHEGLSHGCDPSSGGKVHQVRNRVTFVERWRETLEREQLPRGAHAFLARDRSQLKKSVLVIERHPPEPDRDAGSRAMWQLMRVLYLQGFNVKFWSHERGSDPAYADALRNHGIEVLGAGADDSSFDDWIAAHGCYLDHVVLSRPMVAKDYLESLRRHTHATIVYYGHDIHYQRIGRHHELTGDPALRRQAEDVRKMEEGIWRSSDLVLYPSDEETLQVKQWLAGNGVEIEAKTIPLFAYEDIPAPESLPGPGARTEVVFVGGFAHAPNADAVLWFAREVWPLVRERHPDSHLWLVGADPSDEIQSLAAEDVHIAGHVSESALAGHYERARVVVAPLRFGAGTKGKVVESMRHGVPCVTTTTGRQGLSDAAFLRVADDAPTMAALISELWEDSDAWLEASRASLQYVRERYSVQTVWNALSATMDPTPYPDVETRQRRLAECLRKDDDPADVASPDSAQAMDIAE